MSCHYWTGSRSLRRGMGGGWVGGEDSRRNEAAHQNVARERWS